MEKMNDTNIISAEVCEDNEGGWALYIVPKVDSETYITENEMRRALVEIDSLK